MPTTSWQQHIDHVTAKGVLAKRLYVILTTPDGGSMRCMPTCPRTWPTRRTWRRAASPSRAGPFADDTETEWSGEGMIIVRAASLADAVAIANADPMHSAACAASGCGPGCSTKALTPSRCVTPKLHRSSRLSTSIRPGMIPMAIREKTTITMRMAGVALSHARTDVSIRGLTKVIDEPVERGGTNLGMSPTETFAASLVGCTNVISHKIAHRMGIELQAMKIRLEADFDRRGVTLAEDVAIPFPAMTLNIDVASDATPEQMRPAAHASWPCTARSRSWCAPRAPS